jgi:hypothetical protein
MPDLDVPRFVGPALVPVGAGSSAPLPEV